MSRTCTSEGHETCMLDFVGGGKGGRAWKSGVDDRVILKSEVWGGWLESAGSGGGFL